MYIDAVSSAIVHSSGSVVATCSGQRKELRSTIDESDSGSDTSSRPENDHTSSEGGNEEAGSDEKEADAKGNDISLRVWSIT